MSEVERFRLSGTLLWPSLDKPNEFTTKYQVDIAIDDNIKIFDADKKLVAEGAKEALMYLDDKGIEPKVYKKGDYESAITLRTKFEPKVVDSKGKKFDVEDVKIGNGTTVNVIAHMYDWTFKKKKGKGLGLDAIQIVNLVEYAGKTVSFDDVDGFTNTDDLSFDDEETEVSSSPF